MNKPFIALFSACIAGAACFAYGQATAPPTEKEMRANTTPQEGMEQGKDVVGTQRKYFAGLDRHQKGYLNIDDVSADPFLSGNFAKCDANHDGRLTSAEYAACTRENPPLQR